MARANAVPGAAAKNVLQNRGGSGSATDPFD